MSLLGIDLGSSGCKGVIFNYNGKVLSKYSLEYCPYSPAPEMAEMDPEIFWHAVVKVITNLTKTIPSETIEALSISSHGETFIAVDSDGKAIAPAVMNSDNRAVQQAKRLEKTIGKEKVYQITGLPPHPMFSLNKIIWIKENMPDIFERARRFVSVGDYILMKMGLPPYTDYSLASRVMAFDIKNRRWSEEILNYSGIKVEKLSIPMPSGTIAGKLSSSTAKILGLKEGTIIAIGGHDQPCGALGSGVINPGEVFDSAGTYECLVAVSQKPGNTTKALSYGINSYCHVVRDKFVTLAFFPAGIVTRWFVEQFCADDKLYAQQQNKILFEVLDENIANLCNGPTGLCITPHFVGACNPYWDVTATGVMAGLTPQITKYHIYKAIYEGIACELAVNVEVLEEVIGHFNTIMISGGNANSPFTVQLRADITGKEMLVSNTAESVCQGAAILAGIAAGVYKDAEDAVSKVVKISKVFSPDKNEAMRYAKQIQQYRQVYPSLEKFRKARL
ncbi:MAG: hypothetical protein GX754_00210 [Clostridiaceae bacterium]|nr:hypothetical protein [Clostridiaceae bacterium]